jgi:hypothetical protein
MEVSDALGPRLETLDDIIQDRWRILGQYPDRFKGHPRFENRTIAMQLLPRITFAADNQFTVPTHYERVWVSDAHV